MLGYVNIKNNLFKIILFQIKNILKIATEPRAEERCSLVGENLINFTINQKKLIGKRKKQIKSQITL
jgi:hypothetical protein